MFQLFSRNLRLMVALLFTDTSLQQNFHNVRSIKTESLESGLLEAFMESAPQFILQLSIVIRTGIISKYNCHLNVGI